jgi:hypothetical protein
VQQWDYAAIPVTEADLGELLTRMGAAGWELVTIWGNYFVFKRPKVADAKDVGEPFLTAATARTYEGKRGPRWGYVDQAERQQ